MLACEICDENCWKGIRFILINHQLYSDKFLENVKIAHKMSSG